MDSDTDSQIAAPVPRKSLQHTYSESKRIQAREGSKQKSKKQPNNPPQQKKKAKKGGRKKKEEEPASKPQPKQKKKPKSIKKNQEENDQKQVITDYMLKQNRPYSSLNVFDNLKGEIKKAQVQRLLDELSQEEVLQVKQYGKARIYVYHQKHLPVIPEQQLKQIDGDIAKSKQKILKIKDENKAVNQQLKQLNNQMSIPAMKEKILQEEKRIDQMRQKIDMYFGQDREVLSDQVINAAEKKIQKSRAIQAKMKRGFFDIIDALGEGMQKTRKEMIALLKIDLPQ